MNESPTSVKTHEEPQLFRSGAVVLSLQALCDYTDETIVWVCEARDPIDGKLRALWSTGPLPFHDADEHSRMAGREFTRLFKALTGPFSDPFSAIPG